MTPLSILTTGASVLTMLIVLVGILAVAALMFKQRFIPFGMMAALTTDRITETKHPGLKSYPVKASTKIYDGALVAVDSNGYALPAADTSGLKVVGVADSTVDNSSGAAGDLWINVKVPIIARFDASSITQAMVGQVMYVVDDHTFDDAIGTNAIKAGRLVEFISTTEGWLEVFSSGEGAKTADADATYGQPEADLINELKTIVNKRLCG